MNEKLLEEIGLTKGEIKVYLTLLKIGETTTGKIIEEAEISSGKIYEILDKLIKKGLVSYNVKEKTRHFNAASPRRILDYLYEKEKDLKEKEEEFVKELPILMDMQKSKKKKYETKLFKGFKGFETAVFEALDDLSKEDEVLAMGIISGKKEQYNILWEKWHKQRIKNKIKCRVLFSDKGTSYYRLFKKMPLTQVRVIEGITPTSVDIMGDKVLILTHGDEPSCLVVDNEEIAESFRSFFETLWRVSK